MMPQISNSFMHAFSSSISSLSLSDSYFILSKSLYTVIIISVRQLLSLSYLGIQIVIIILTLYTSTTIEKYLQFRKYLLHFSIGIVSV